MKGKLACVIGILAAGLAAKPSSGPPPSSPQVMEVFNVDQNPGSGNLKFTSAQKPRAISLGKESGYYGLGMVFDGSVLPAAVGKRYRDRQFIQIALGTNPHKLTGQVPQFLQISIITGKLPKKATTFKLSVPAASENPLQSLALMMFSPPETPSQQSDEDKLKNTYFAGTGTLKLTPQNTPHDVEITTQSQTLKYLVQMMRIEMDSTLLTPFNAQENDISGSVTVPVYWPNGKTAKELMQQIARESFAAGGPIPASEGYAPKAPAK